MKKLIVLIALVAFIGVSTAPVYAAPSTFAVEEVEKGKEKKATKKAKKTKKAEAKSECASTCSKTCSGDKKKSDGDK